jgi:hypothetical protein
MYTDDGDRLVKLCASKIKFEDITHRGFLKPIEIALKTFKTEMISNPDSQIRPGSLPAGLKIAVKTSKDSDKRNLVDVGEIYENEIYHDL